MEIAISGAGSAIGGIIGGGPFGSSVGGAMAGAIATVFMDGSTKYDIGNNFISGFLSGATGAEIGNLLLYSGMNSMNAAVYNGILSGFIDSFLLAGDPIVSEPCKGD